VTASVPVRSIVTGDVVDPGVAGLRFSLESDGACSVEFVEVADLAAHGIGGCGEAGIGVARDRRRTRDVADGAVAQAKEREEQHLALAATVGFAGVGGGEETEPVGVIRAPLRPEPSISSK